MDRDKSSLILLVDDNPKNLQVLGNLLSDYRTAVATSGLEALKFIKKIPPDLILLDIMMPGMDGFEVCEILQSSPDTRAIPIIFVTAKTETEDVVKGFQLGAVDYVTKPFRKEELLVRIGTHLKLKQTETALRQAVEDHKSAKETAENASKAKSDFLAKMSHEIRTPMNAILGMTDLTLQTDLTAHQKSNLEAIRESTHHLLSIVNDILDLSKIEAGKIELEHVDFNLRDLLETVARTMSIQATQKDLFLKLEQSEDVPRFVLGDPVRLRQILVNLVGNAIKFTNEGGVTLGVEMRNGKWRMENGRQDVADQNFIEVLFSVQDTGVGIAPENIDKIFENFDQGDRSTTRYYGGTGLGLSISRHLAELMGGRLWVESELGVGSVFSFFAKLKPGNPDHVPEKKTYADRMSAARAGRPLSVLVAEDNYTNAEIAKAFLKRLGHRPVVVTNGKSAISVLSGAHFDIVLMDVEMPEMDGVEATRQIRAGEAGLQNREIPIIALTGHAVAEFRDISRQAGMDDFVAKPIDFYELGILIKNTVAENKRSKHTSENPSETRTAHHQPTHSLLFNKKAALDRLGNDQAMFKNLCDYFLSYIPQQMETLAEAVKNRRKDETTLMAHSLKSVFASIGAESCSSIAKRIEWKSRHEENADVRPEFENLEKELAMLMADIESDRCEE